MPDYDPAWTASRKGQDWRDEDILRATNWLKSLVPEVELAGRLGAVKACLNAAVKEWQKGNLVSAYDPADISAWYIFQAEAFATDRQNVVLPEMVRIAPTMKRLGKELDILLTIGGIEERARRVVTTGKSTPDNGLFELLVALAYRRHGWDHVEFVPEQTGSKTPDLHVADRRRKWAVECKRFTPTLYDSQQKQRGEMLAKPVHELSLQLGRSLMAFVVFHTELNEVADDYLLEATKRFLAKGTSRWEDKHARGMVADIDWRLARHVLNKDYVYFGSSRMIELIAGQYQHDAEHSLSIKWRPASERPLYADAVYHASLISWKNHSATSLQKRSRHFRSVMGRAERQLPSNRPGVIHMGIESWHGAEVDATRHLKNLLETKFFDVASSRLRWVYGNYFVPEMTTRHDETWALTETMVPYKIGSHSTSWPLPGHLLISDEDGFRAGAHWDGG